MTLKVNEPFQSCSKQQTKIKFVMVYKQHKAKEDGIRSYEEVVSTRTWVDWINLS